MRCRFLVPISILFVLGSIMVPQQAGAGPNPNPNSGPCAWAMRADASGLNVAYPDTAAVYWVTPYMLFPGTTIVIEGSFPDARYMSFGTYAFTGEPVGGFADIDIDPDQGATNPFRADVSPESDRRYTVSVEPGFPEGPNVLPGLPGGATLGIGVVIYRIYLPASAGDPAGGVPLPSLTFEYFGGAGQRPARDCGDTSEPGALDVGEAPALPSIMGGPSPAFTRPFDDGGMLFSNLDNAYLGAPIVNIPGRVAVIRAKAPTVPETDPEPQLRYWSVCTNELLTTRVAACAVDMAFPVDADGLFTAAVSNEADKPVNATLEAGVVWLPWGERSLGLILYRHMLPAENFAHAIQGVNAGDNPQEAMGLYAPEIFYCTTTSFEEVGPAACRAG